MMRYVNFSRSAGLAVNTQFTSRVQDIFAAALARPSSERADFAGRQCAGDETLLLEVLLLLRLHDEMERCEQPFQEPDEQPRRFGAYEVVRALGSGGMGRVYLGRRMDGAFERLVAIKIIHVEKAHDPDLVRTFELERRILASLHHPNIAMLLDAGATAAGQLFLVAEYVDGLPITDYCSAHALTLKSRIALFHRVCEAVSYAHQNLIVHRDLKPANILVTASGSPKLVDFGIAKWLAGDPDLTVVHRATPAYASPEQLAGQAGHPSMDIYSLGVLLYELVTGSRPSAVDDATPTEDLSARAPSGVLASRASSALAPPGITRSQLAGDIDAIVKKALRMHPGERYASVDALLRDLDAWDHHKPVLARGGGRAYRMAKFIRRNRVSVAAAAAVAVALTFALVTAARSWANAEEQRYRAERRFEAVQQLADSMFVLDATLVRTPGATPARQVLVDAIATYLRSVDATEPTLMIETAEAYRRLGDIEGNPNNANLGHRESAVEKQSVAIAMLQRVAPDNQDDRVQEALARAVISRGDTLIAMERFDQALKDYEGAADIVSALRQRRPNEAKYKTLLAGVHRPVGDIWLARGNPGLALKAYERALALDELAAVGSTDRREFDRVRALTLIRIGSVKASQGALGEARQQYEQARELFEHLTATGSAPTVLAQLCGRADAIASVPRSTTPRQWRAGVASRD